MLVLFDQGTPVPLRQFLAGHTIRTAAEQQWTTLENGQLLDAAEAAGFDLLLTTDQNIRHQQNFAGRSIAIVVLGQARWPIVQNHVARVVAAVNAATTGSYTLIEIPAQR